jgi:hypothetical protein
MQLERLPWKPVVATFVAAVAVTYGFVEHPATPRRFPSPRVALGVGRASPPGLPQPSASTGMPIAINQAVSAIGSGDEARGATSLPPSVKVASPAESAPASLDAGPPNAASVAGPLMPDADGATAAAAPLATSVDASTGSLFTPSGSNDGDHLGDRRSLDDESAMMSIPRHLTSSSFDDEDLVDRHPVPDDEPPFIRKPPPLTSSSFEDEDLVDRHPVPR